MDMALNDYIQSRNIGADGMQIKQQQKNDQQQQPQQQQQKQQQQQQWKGNQRNGQQQQRQFMQRNLPNNDQRIYQGHGGKGKRNFQRHAQNGKSNQCNRNGFKNMNRPFDLRLKCGRQRQQQHHQEQQRHSNSAYPQNARGRNFRRSNDRSNGNHARNCDLNLSKQCQQQQKQQCNTCTIAAIQKQQQQQQQQLVPICHQHIPADNAIVPCHMLPYHSNHASTAMLPFGMAHNHGNAHAFGCHAQSACIAAAAAGGGGCGVAGNLFDNSLMVMNAFSKLLSSNNSTPLRLTLQVPSNRIADDVEEMDQAN